MTPREKIAKALMIMESAEPNGLVCAEHDQFLIGSPDIKLTGEEKRVLKKLGAYYDEDDGWYFFV